MNSSIFGGGFKSAKCKTLLRLAMSRIKLLRNKRDVQVKQMRKEIAKLLSTGQDPSARIRVEHVAREQNVMAAYDLIELFCELIIARLSIIESHKVCPMDLKEAISSLIFASPRCADLPELSQIRSVFSSKYGKEFVAAATELRPDCGVNRRVVEKLSVRAPSGEIKLKLLTEIAAEHQVSWDPAASLAELLKRPEDLLDGPTKFFGASEMPIPEPRPSPPKPAESSVSFPQRVTVSTKFFGAKEMPRAEPRPFPPKPDEASLSFPQRATVRTQVPPARPAPSVHQLPTAQLSSPESEDDASDKKQIPPFARPVHTKGTPRPQTLKSPSKGTAAGRRSVTFELAAPNPTENLEARAGKDVVGPENRIGYDNVAAAAKSAAQSADRAVAAARAAAELATTHPFKREQIPSRSSSHARYDSSSSDEDSRTAKGSSRRSNQNNNQQPPSRSSCNARYDSSSSDEDGSTAKGSRRSNQSTNQQPARPQPLYMASDSYRRGSTGFRS